MNVKAVFPEGMNEIFVNGLHQWDYGQQLQIEAADLPAMVEVHFSCPTMTEAIVRTCSVNTGSGTATVTIPDICLEQTAPITAWVYQIGGTSGATIKIIKMIVTPRPRPANSKDVEVIESNKYTELLSAVTSQVASLKAGNVTVKKALSANTATTSETATRASLADLATKATTADVASRVDFASDDISKGTIEARLSSLGFKHGAFEIVGSFGSRLEIITNTITKIGKCVLASFEAEFSNISTQYLELRIPDVFKPAKETKFLLEKEDTDVEDGRLASMQTVHANGYMSIGLGLTDYNSGWVRFYNVGWELADSLVFPTIRFTIDGITCYAERGMTWRDLYNSPYNSKQLSLRGPQYGYSEVWVEHEDTGQEYYISGEDWDNEIWEGAEYYRDGY